MWAPEGITPRELVDVIMEIANVKPGDVFYDLGCGDGRMLIAAAKRGARAVGIEIREEYCRLALENAKMSGCDGLVRVVKGDFFEENVSNATVVYLYLTIPVNRLLAPKLSRELKPGTRVIALDYPIEVWRPVGVVEIHDGLMKRKIHLYIIGTSNNN